jgi:hypothetical protein
MLPYFTRLRLASRTFFAILDYGRVPTEVAEMLEPAPPSPARPAPAPPPPAAAPAPATTRPVEPAPPARAAAAAGDDQDRAAQLLALLQRDSRLVDFLMEDIAPYADAQIGAAVRDVHTGARESLQRYVTLEPVLEGDEGATITVPEGLDAADVKVMGHVTGAPPYRGILRHRGWRARRLDLPPLGVSGRRVVAPAEVELP